MAREQIFHLGVKAIIQNSAGNILILKHAEKNFWDLPGGRVQQDENIQETLLREVQEETGITQLINIKPYGMLLTSIQIHLADAQKAGLIYYCHTCMLVKAQPIILSPEHIDFMWATWEEAQALLSVDFTNMLYHREAKAIVKDKKEPILE